AERFKAPVLKTGRGASSSWVRIPPHPPPLIFASSILCADDGKCPVRARRSWLRLLLRLDLLVARRWFESRWRNGSLVDGGGNLRGGCSTGGINGGYGLERETLNLVPNEHRFGGWGQRGGNHLTVSR